MKSIEDSYLFLQDSKKVLVRVPNSFNKAPTNVMKFLSSLIRCFFHVNGIRIYFNRDLIRLKGIPIGLGSY